MYTSDTNLKTKNKHFIKTVVIYLLTALFCIVVNMVYAQFGHGVSSNSMTYMFLYPLLGGTLFYAILGFVILKSKVYSGYRLFYNVYNSAIAMLTVGSFLKGVVEIAGTNSVFISYYYMVGGSAIVLSFLILIIGLLKSRKTYS